MLTRLLTVVLLALAGTVVFFRLRGDPAEPGTQATSAKPPNNPEARPADANQLPLIHTRSLSTGLENKGQWRGKPALADLNGDGKLDLVASVRRWDNKTAGEGLFVWLGDGKGGWKPMIDGLRRDMGYGGAAVADVNGDGKPDIAFSGHDVTPHVFLNLLEVQGQSTWVPTTEGIDIENICADVALGDFDGDGKMDLVAIGQFPARGGLLVFRGDGEGKFTRVAELFDKKHYGARVAFADLDGNGRVAILAATDLGPRVWQYGKDGTFNEISKGLVVSKIGGSDLAIMAMDLDGDGKPELLTAGLAYEDHPCLRIYRREGDGWTIISNYADPTMHVWDAAFFRLEKNGQPMLATATKQGVVIFSVSARGEITLRGVLEGTKNAANLCVGDINGDGRDEIVYVGFDGVHVMEILDMKAGQR